MKYEDAPEITRNGMRDAGIDVTAVDRDRCDTRPTNIDGIHNVLNHYDGDNIFEDVIYRLEYDEEATNAVATTDTQDAVISGHHFRQSYGYRDRVVEWCYIPPDEDHR